MELFEVSEFAADDFDSFSCDWITPYIMILATEIKMFQIRELFFG